VLLQLEETFVIMASAPCHSVKFLRSPKLFSILIKPSPESAFANTRQTPATSVTRLAKVSICVKAVLLVIDW
jgi:hypothetical protein